MKTLLQMLRELCRADVAEFAVVSDRLPCVKVAGTYEPIDDTSRSTESILEMLVASGGSRYVEELEAKPAQWTTRVEGIGAISVTAAMRGGRAQARFALVQRPSVSAPAEGANARFGVEAAAPEEPTSRTPTRGSMRPSSSLRARRSKPPDLHGVSSRAREDETPAEPGTSRPETMWSAAVVQPSAAQKAGFASSLDELLATARDAGASDLHVVAGRPMLLRVAGELLARGLAIDEAAVEAMIVPMVPERVRPMLEQQGSCDFAVERARGRFRVNVARQRTGLKACFRCIPAAVPTLASLGIPVEIERATRHHQGLVLVTGPTGHGKTSTLAALVDIINAGTTHHVITVEDPVEYLHPRKKAMISQREVGTHTRSFEAALKASLREDPDVIVVGELRDTETVRMALAASETGHLVLGTMNTPSAAKTIDRLVDLFPPADQQQVRMTLAGGLHLIVSQRLLPAADGKAMVAAVELLPGSVALWSLIRDNKTYQIPSLQQRGKGFGILRLDDSLADLVRAGRVARATALAIAENPDELEAVLSGKRPPIAAVQLFGKKGA
jgi:twitching motility protein PilT